MSEADGMKFAEFICFEATIPELAVTDRDGAIEAMVASLNKAGKLKRGSAKEVVKALVERENEASTGIGKGVAVPHVKHPKAKRIMAALGRSAQGVDFSALDRAPVYIVVLLLSPADNPDEHLQAMENIFRHLQRDNFRRFLRQSETTEAIMDLIKEADELPTG